MLENDRAFGCCATCRESNFRTEHIFVAYMYLFWDWLLVYVSLKVCKRTQDIFYYFYLFITMRSRMEHAWLEPAYSLWS